MSRMPTTVSGDKASAMVLRGTTWTQLGTQGFSAGAIGSPSLAISPEGVPAVAYQDQANNYDLTVMEFQ